MELNTDKLRSGLQRQIDNLESQKRELEERVAEINRKLKDIHLTQEALDTVVRQAAFLDDSDEEVKNASVEAVSRESKGTGRKQQLATETTFSLAGRLGPVDTTDDKSSAVMKEDGFGEEDEETLRMVENLFQESDPENSEPPTNGRRQTMEALLPVEGERASGDPSKPVEAASGQEIREAIAEASGSKAESLMPRFLKKYL